MLILTIKSRADFVSVNKEALRFYSPTILLLGKKTNPRYLQHPRDGKIVDCCRVGYTVSKQIGNAVIRNKVKRKYREAFRALYLSYALTHFDYVIVARKDAAIADSKKISNDLKFCLKGIKKLLNQNAKSGK